MPIVPEVQRRRLASQLLAGDRARDPVAVAERITAVQAQDLRGARLAVRARSEGLSAADFDRALAERKILISWLNRGTLHLVRREDYPWLHELTAPRTVKANVRRLAQEGIEPRQADRGVEVIASALADDGPLTRQQLGARLDRAGVRTEGQALVHLLLAATLRGLIVRGPLVGGQHAFVLVRDWLGEPDPIERDAALAELARRFLAGHGPAGDRDLAKWAGITLGDARRGLRSISGELEQGTDGELVDLAGRPAAPDPLAPLLLGPFDSLLMGWTSREPVLGPHAGVVTINGIFKPFALVDGRAAATWGMPGGRVEIRPFGSLSAEVEAALDAEADDVIRYLEG